MLIFRKSEDDKLVDSELLLYPQYLSLKKEESINNKKLNNISQNLHVYTTLMNETQNNNNNKRVGQKHFDIVKSSFNKDS